ncbi:electron transfer flavoprotein-ubiquinone oxidoreductase [Candidatus Sumerlaeota bacterium]|nr:electron transfer flavoprotein-ubiquinone oxidoreductase [Candidatus Sumerlaeota bacterium]
MTPTQERESMELDVVFVGAGVANLCAAYRFMREVKSRNEKAAAEGRPPIEEPTVLAIDKGAQVGSHTLSGAVVDPTTFRELFPDLEESDLPFVTPVKNDGVYYLTPSGKIPVPAPLLPKEMRNSGGYHIASIAEMTRWLAAKCEEEGIEVYTEFAATELLRDGDRIVGARIGDKGLDKEGNPGEGYAAGMDLLAKVTVLGEGTRGYLSQRLIRDFRLDAESNSQTWALGIKELIEIPEGRIEQGAVIHTFGYPLDISTYGGSFVYALSDTLVAVGLVMGLDYPNPLFNTHGAFLQLKAHPLVAEIVKGGKVVEYGAKTLPEGGYFALPRLATDGAVLVGDGAGFVNSMRLKGIHLAMKSGALAADRILNALTAGDFSARALDYKPDFDSSWAGAELRRARNYRQSYHGGLIPGMMATGMHMFSGGALPPGRKTMPPDHKGLRKASAGRPTPKTPTDDALYLDILTDVYKSGSIHNEHQPPHCKILDPSVCERCREEYAMPCTRFCPAKVYEENLDPDGRFLGIQVNFSNCVHCKTCEIKDPLENLEWTPPEGGDGPKYQKM